MSFFVVETRELVSPTRVINNNSAKILTRFCALMLVLVALFAHD
jgi:hypothetical protein